MVERVAELNETTGSLKARLAAAEIEVARLLRAGPARGDGTAGSALEAGEAERLSSLLESQTQALTGQCLRLQHETTYIRKVSKLRFVRTAVLDVGKEDGGGGGRGGGT